MVSNLYAELLTDILLYMIIKIDEYQRNYTIGLASLHQILPTIVAAIMVSSVLTGVFLFILGSFQIGNLIRFVPYPVLGGYFAGAGFLLVKGSFSLMTGIALKPEHIQFFLENNNLILWIPGIIFAILLFVLERRYKHFLLMPVLLLLHPLAILRGLALESLLPEYFS